MARNGLPWRERFLAKSENKNVLRLDASARSQFSVPTFSNLSEALQHYARENVRESTCYIFKDVWHDANRLFLKAGPESKIGILWYSFFEIGLVVP